MSPPENPSAAKARKRYRKPTVEQKEARVAEVSMLMAHSATRCQVHRIMCPKYDVHWRTADRYMACARKLAMERVGKTRTDALAEAISFYDSVMLDPSATRKEKMDARERLDKIQGVYAPTALRVGDPQGKPIAPTVVAPVVNYVFPANNRDRARSGSNGEARAEKARSA